MVNFWAGKHILYWKTQVVLYANKLLYLDCVFEGSGCVFLHALVLAECVYSFCFNGTDAASRLIAALSSFAGGPGAGAAVAHLHGHRHHRDVCDVPDGGRELLQDV